jgi:quercetin dioxygenase-like cupin family protein
MSGSRVLRWSAGRWEGIAQRAYKDPAEGLFRGVTRQVLAGGRADDEAALDFELRYFEIAAGGYSTLERHGHAHAVVVLVGRGSVDLEGVVSEIGPHDFVYVAAHAPHRFRAAAETLLGFLCIVDRERDRPVPLGS